MRLKVAWSRKPLRSAISETGRPKWRLDVNIHACSSRVAQTAAATLSPRRGDRRRAARHRHQVRETFRHLLAAYTAMILA
jgi:hypothetical protein